jgi:hypothetical protein
MLNVGQAFSLTQPDFGGLFLFRDES